MIKNLNLMKKTKKNYKNKNKGLEKDIINNKK